MKIGVFKEIVEGECCVVVSVEIVKKFVGFGVIVVVEKGVGLMVVVDDVVYEVVGVMIGMCVVMIKDVDILFGV